MPQPPGRCGVTVFLDDGDVRLHLGDCIDVMRAMPAASVDTIATDPPYGLEFMGQAWDRPWAVSPSNRVGYSGRDDLRLPSHRDSRNANCRTCGGRQRGAKRCRCDVPEWDRHPVTDMHTFQEWCEEWGREALRVLKPGGHLAAFGGTRTYHRLTSGLEDAGFEIRDTIAWLYGSGFPKSLNLTGEHNGRGTALKPAHEPIVLARKPLEGTVAANVLAHGTGALNIDACRIGPGHGGASCSRHGEQSASRRYAGRGGTNSAATPGPRGGSPSGRWPANVVLDEDAAATLDAQAGSRGGNAPASGPRFTGRQEAGVAYGARNGMGDMPPAFHGDDGGPSRFFYTSKASSSERGDGNTHPTVKPVDLMRWLVRLITPPEGLVLDPFGGSGTTGVACRAEGIRCVLIERDEEYVGIIARRLQQLSLLGGAA